MTTPPPTPPSDLPFHGAAAPLKRGRGVAAVLAGLVLALEAGCGGGGGGAASAGPTPPSGPVASCPISTVPTTPSWSTHIYPLIQQGCGVSSTSCHDNPGTRVNFNQGSSALYTALVNAPTISGPSGWVYIKPSDDLTAVNRRSWIYEKVDPLVVGSPGGGIGTTMPAGSSLCRPSIDTLKAWIIAGAPHN